jgi:GNAT superfamily N-acetyltransferase
MHIEQGDLADAGTVRACHGVFLAALRVDAPEDPPMGERVFDAWLTVGWAGDPREVWLVRGQAAGSVAGWYRLELPDQENLDRAYLDLIVHPAERQRGLGLALLRHAAGRAAARGRSVLGGAARNGSAGEAFARSVGAEPGLVEVERVLELRTLDPGRLAGLRDQAERAAAGYSLRSWTGLVPEELMAQLAAVYTALGDAPRDAGVAREVWDAQRVRERVNGLRPRYGVRHYAVAAIKGDRDAGGDSGDAGGDSGEVSGGSGEVSGGSGEMAALTEVAVDPADPGWGHQMITAVTREHRGHRLGLLVKLVMLELLAAQEPQLRRILTSNAESNAHMIAVNEALGYTILGQPATSWQLDVAVAVQS